MINRRVVTQGDFLRLDRTHWMMKDLVAWWPMQEGAGETLFDVSPNRNNGVLTNMNQSTDWLVSSRGGKSLDFDGHFERIDVAGITSLTLPFSVSMWFKLNSTASAQRLFSLNAGGTGANVYSLYTQDTAIYCQHYDTNNATASASISANQWYHVVAVFVSNSERSIYIDGEFKDTDTQSQSALTTDNFNLGVLYWSTGYIQTLNGNMSDVRVYDRQLSDSEIRKIYLNPWAPLSTKSKTLLTASAPGIIYNQRQILIKHQKLILK